MEEEAASDTEETEETDEEKTEAGVTDPETEMPTVEEKEWELPANVTYGPEPEPIIEYDYEWKIQKQKVPLKIKLLPIDVQPMNKTNRKDSIKVLIDLDDADRAVAETAEAFNDLESYVLEHRPYFYEDEDEYIMKVSTEEDREEFIRLLNEVEDWLYEVEEPSAGVFKAKKREVVKKVQPVFVRAYELQARPQVVATAKERVHVIRAFVKNMTETMTWVPEEEFEKLNNQTTAFQKWFSEKLEDQAGREVTEQPAFTLEQVKSKLEKLSDDVTLISKRPKPKEKKKKKDKKKKKKGNDTDSDGTEDPTSEVPTEDGEEK
eukprot:UN24755